MKRFSLFIYFILFSILAFCQTVGIEDDGYSLLDGITVDNFPVVDGSDSTEPLRDILMCKTLGYDYVWERYSPFLKDPQKAKQEIKPEYPSYEICQYLNWERQLRSNTHESFVNLIDGTANLVIAARNASRDENVYAKEKGVALIEKPIAKDALTFMVSLKNNATALTTQEIQNIYMGNITNWKEVGGPDLQMTPFIRNKNSGSQEKFETTIMNGLTIAKIPEWHVGRTMNAPYSQIEATAGGLAFTPFYFYSVIIGYNSTRALDVDGVAMTKENIMNGTYPYITEVYASVRSDIDRDSPAYRMFEFLTTPAGQAMVDESGYISLSAFTNIGSPKVSSTKLTYSNGDIMIHSEKSPASIKVIGLSGAIMIAKPISSNHLQTGNLPKGTYIIKIAFHDGTSYDAKIQI